MLLSLVKYISNYSSKSFLTFLVFIIFIANISFVIGYFLLPILASGLVDKELFENTIKKFANIGIFSNFSFSDLCLFALAAIIISNFLTLFYIWYSTKFSNDLGAKIQSAYFNFFIKKNFIFFLNKEKSALANDLIIDIYRLVQGAIIPFFSLINAIIISIIIFITLLLINPKITLAVIFIFSFIYFLVFLIIKKKLFHTSDEFSKAQAKLLKIIEFCFSPVREIKLYKQENRLAYNIDINTHNISKIKTFLLFATISPRYFLEGIALSAGILVMFFLNKYNLISKSQLLEISFFILAIIKVLPSMQQLYVNISQIQSNKKLINKFSNFKNLKNIEKNPNKETKLNNTFENINYKNISFSYKKNKLLINNINLNVKKGDWISLIGNNGSGKTSLLNILMGLIVPTKGSVYLNNKKIKYKFLQDYFHCLDVNPIFLEQDLKNSITFGKDKKFSNKKFNQIIKQSYLLNKFKKLKKNQLINFNYQLSQGEKQKLNFARFLYFNRPILVIDEGTSNLSAMIEKKIFKKLKKNKNQTVIYVSHRMVHRKYFNKFYKIQNNKLIKLT